MLQRLEKLSEIQFKTKFYKLILNVRVDDEEAQIQQAPQAALNEQITAKKNISLQGTMCKNPTVHDL